jgi:hypothetical protein
MEKFNINYSGKNIPLPSRTDYKKKFIEAIEKLIKNMRWKAFFYLKANPDSSTDSEEDTREDHYGLKSRCSPPQIEEMADFERDMLQMIENLQFRKINEPFMNQLPT